MGGPRCKLRRIPEKAGSMGQITQFDQTGTKLNLLRNFEGIRRPTSSGLRSWGISRDATGCPHFLIVVEGGLAWPSFFATGRTFLIYIAHLEED